MKVTNKDIINFNELYHKCKNYAQVARETGFSPATVKKYVDKNYIPQEERDKRMRRFMRSDLTEISYDIFKGVDNWGDLCALSDEEKEEMKRLWEEMSI